jgi:hypothetical protein
MATSTILLPTIIAPCRFKLGDRVELPSMAHLGSGRVVDVRFTEDRWIGGYWMVTVKMARTASLVVVPEVKLRAC